MRMRVKLSKSFTKQYDKADTKIRKAFDKNSLLFLKDPFNSQLRNHPLKGSFKGLRSINVTGDWRALYREIISDGDTYIIFEFLGTHSQLYK